MDDNPHVLSTDMDLFVDSQPMNDEELSRLHESTLQMFRSNKIGPKNAFDIVLIDYLPAIFEASTFEDDRINHFQSVGTTLETSAKIYAARIDSLYSETRKAQSILRSNQETMQRILDEDDEETLENEDEGSSERRAANPKKIHLMMKKKKSIVTDRQKLLRKNRMDEIRPIMRNQFFLSAMHHDNMLLSELYEKIVNSSNVVESKKKKMKTDSNDLLSSSLNSHDFPCEPLYIDTSNTSVVGSETELSPLSDVLSINKSHHLLTPSSMNSASSVNLSAIQSSRSRTNSIISDSSILTNAANLLADTPSEYSYLDSNKVHAFIDELNPSNSISDVLPSPIKPIRKRRLSLEYPFPFLVEQAKKQRLMQKKLRDELQQNQREKTHDFNPFLRPPSPEYSFATDEAPLELAPVPNESMSLTSPPTSRRQRNIDFRHLQSKMQKHILKAFESNDQICFSELFSQMQLEDQHQTSSSSDIGLSFAALLNNAVRSRLILQTNEPRDDIAIASFSPADGSEANK